MNVFKALYCNQYYELKPQGKEDTAQKMGTILSTIALVLFLLSAFFLLMTFMPDFEKELYRFFKSAFGRRTGKAIGKFAGILCLLIGYPIIKFTVGTNKSYNTTITEFNNKSIEEQKQISKKGLKFFVSSVAIIIIVVIIMAIYHTVFD
ncbi:hypothetical protein [Pontimicrobium sp. IMCC45349]|uniref:hypothetical protein n=1 Tax=Pontimicrobium sp. IMCC45349 TaxID=3391574 RepID=UPI0039A3934E